MPNCPICNKSRVQQSTIDKYGKCSECNSKKLSKELQLDTQVTKTYKKKAISTVLREQVWRKYYGNSLDGVCPICNKKLSYTDHDCAHIIAESQGGATDINNLRPTHKRCNQSMGVTHLDEFKNLVNPATSAQDNNVNTRYILMWNDIRTVHEYYDDHEYDDEEKKMQAEDSVVWLGWLEIQKVYTVILYKLINIPNDPLLKNKYSKIFIDYLNRHEVLCNAVKYAPRDFGSHMLVRGRDLDIEYKAYWDTINSQFKELDAKYFRFRDVADAKKIANNVKSLKKINLDSQLIEDLDFIERIFNSLCLQYEKCATDSVRNQTKEVIAAVVRYTFLLLRNQPEKLFGTLCVNEIEFMESRSGSAEDNFKDFVQLYRTSKAGGKNWIDRIMIKTFYELMFTDCLPYMNEDAVIALFN